LAVRQTGAGDATARMGRGLANFVRIASKERERLNSQGSENSSKGVFRGGGASGQCSRKTGRREQAIEKGTCTGEEGKIISIAYADRQSIDEGGKRLTQRAKRAQEGEGREETRLRSSLWGDQKKKTFGLQQWIVKLEKREEWSL